MKEFVKVALVTILSLIGLALAVILRDSIFSDFVAPMFGLIKNGQPTPIAGTTVLFIWGMIVAVIPKLLLNLKWPIRFHFKLRDDVNWLTVLPVIIALLWAIFPQIWDTIKVLPTSDFTTIYRNFMVGFQPGFFEELVVRGAVLLVFLFVMEKTQWQALGAAIGSSIAFGFVHFINLTGGAPLEDTIQQVIYAVGFGLVFVAIYFRTNSLWIPMVLHGLTDFTSEFQSDGVGGTWMALIIYILPMALMALWLLRPSMNDYNLKSFPEVDDPSLK
ncbi:CPBP family intramembrane glutamic endopeptidase [Weissella confusa]|uniref:CPBP family intramembrane glutamic endopeptidase n=1 Tax=Weissella confusa TaxID=1583 RepID=UPI000989A773|nr:CPBP family intramembrane glutamic endopeptidase [Weissella confusa]SJX67327.1 hypothetical protein FM131_00780 [Weissella confusa]